MKIFEDIYNSFRADEKGLSARKLSAFIAIKTAIVLSYKFGSSETVVMLSIVWLLFAALCFGLVVFKDIIELKNGKKQDA